MTTITSIRKVLSLSPSHPPCDLTAYAPVIGPGPTLYVMGGIITDPQTPGLTSRGRFADKVYRSDWSSSPGVLSAPAVWMRPQEVIGKSLFAWMASERFLIRHPEASIGSVTTPSFVEKDGELHAYFSASVSDPNICTGEHGDPTPHGSCTTPWSYFAIFHAVSADNGLSWELVNHARPNSNTALHHAAIYYEPSTEEARDRYKGLAMTHGIVPVGDWYYLYSEFWSTYTLKNLVFRTRDLYEFEVRDTATAGWAGLFDGEIPAELNSPDSRFPDDKHDGQRGNPLANQLSHVAATTRHPTYPLIGLQQWSGSDMGDGHSGTNNAIAIVRSANGLTWTAPEVIQCAIAPGVLDGTGASDTCLNPHYNPLDGSILFATSDFDLDGQPDCPGGAYQGRAIARAEVDGVGAATGGHGRIADHG